MLMQRRHLPCHLPLQRERCQQRRREENGQLLRKVIKNVNEMIKRLVASSLPSFRRERKNKNTELKCSRNKSDKQTRRRRREFFNSDKRKCTSALLRRWVVLLSLLLLVITQMFAGATSPTTSVRRIKPKIVLEKSSRSPALRNQPVVFERSVRRIINTIRKQTNSTD